MYLAAITALLKGMIENGLQPRDVESQVGGDVLVTALPPDRVTTGGEERAQLNLFLYHITPNTAWRKVDARGSGVDLHYLLTAYGASDLQIELLLSYGLQRLQEAGTRPPTLLRNTLAALLVDVSGRTTAARPDLALLTDELDRLLIAPQFLPLDELSKLWSAFQSRYRPSICFKVTQVQADE